MEAEKICERCKHFRLHYIKRKENYIPLLHGHCVKPRLKKRKADTVACEYWQEKEESPVAGDDWLEKFMRQCDKIRKAVDILTEEADAIATGKRKVTAAKDIFKEE